MDTPRLLIDAGPLVEEHPSGVAHSLVGLAVALRAVADERGFDVTLIAPARSAHRLERWPQLAGVHTIRHLIPSRVLHGMNRFGMLPPMDLLFGRGVYLFGNYINWPLTGRSRSLTFVHDVCFALHPDFVRPRTRELLQQSLPRFLDRSDGVLTVSQSSKREIDEVFPEYSDRLDVVYNAVDPAVYQPEARVDAPALAQALGIPDRYFVFVGNLEPRKNLAVLVDAFTRVSRSSPDVGLVMAGSDGWLNEDLLAAIDRASAAGARIIRPDRYLEDHDVAALMAGAEALIQPSWHEGFSMPPLEALASGTRVLASDIPVHREILGESAVFFDPGSVDELADSMTAVLADVGDEPTSTRASDFTWKRSAEQLLGAIGRAVRRL